MTDEIPHRYFVVRCEPQRERMVAARLVAYQIRAYLPEVYRRRLYGRKMRNVPSPMFPGYLFVNLPVGQEPWDRIRTVPGVMVHDPILGSNGQYWPISAEAVKIIREVEQENQVVGPNNSPFRIGQEVLVSALKDGIWDREAFKAVVCDISRLDRQGRIRVSCQWLGRAVQVSVPATQVKAA